jgi:hypothetical protein
MASPVVEPEQSAPFALTNRDYKFKAFASNTPTYWTSAGDMLPPGLVLNTATGFLEGQATTAGDYTFGLQAGNADGLSDAKLFTIRVRTSPPLPPPGYTCAVIDFKDGSVKFDAGAVISRKSGDSWLQQITLKYGDAVIDAPLSAFKCRLKLIEDDEALTTGADFVKIGSGEGTVYRHVTSLRTDPIDDALELGVQKVKLKDLPTTPASKRIARVDCLVEYELHITNEGALTVGPNPAVWTSQTADVELVRELIPNA